MIVASNFKTNHTRKSTAQYIDAVNRFLDENETSVTTFVFPPASALEHFDGHVKIGAQNAYATVNGAFTGEIGSEQLDEFNIKTVLIGHSERRHILGETQAQIAAKFKFYADLGYTIIYCFGEPLELREQGNDAILEYIDEQFDDIDIAYEKLILAYEPVWAIGTGLTPEVGEIELIHAALKQKINAPLLYGGSVKTTNAKEILSIANVDGALIGSGALKVEDFIEIVKIADEIKGDN